MTLSVAASRYYPEIQNYWRRDPDMAAEAKRLLERLPSMTMAELSHCCSEYLGEVPLAKNCMARTAMTEELRDYFLEVLYAEGTSHD